jgi:transketolase
MPTEPIVDKWASFNWHVIEIHGHNVAEILSALDRANEIHGRPVVIIARTTKGKGVSFMENQPAWHGGIPDDKQFQIALAELEERTNEWRA